MPCLFPFFDAFSADSHSEFCTPPATKCVLQAIYRDASSADIEKHCSELENATIAKHVAVASKLRFVVPLAILLARQGKQGAGQVGRGAATTGELLKRVQQEPVLRSLLKEV